MRTKVMLGSFVFLLMLIAASSVGAFTISPRCIWDATAEFALCVSTCRDAFRVDRDVCHNVNHDCAETCREDFEDCVATPLMDLGGCRVNCDAHLKIAKDTCHSSYQPGTKELDTCIDAAQLSAFSCRDECRETAAPALLQCRRDFRSCIKACPPPEQ